MCSCQRIVLRLAAVGWQRAMSLLAERLAEGCLRGNHGGRYAVGILATSLEAARMR